MNLQTIYGCSAPKFQPGVVMRFAVPQYKVVFHVILAMLVVQIKVVLQENWYLN